MEKTDSSFKMHHSSYISKLENKSFTANYSDFRFPRAKLYKAWNTMPDICCLISKLAQVTQKWFEKEKLFWIKDINKIVCYLQNDAYFIMKFSKIGKTLLRLQIYLNTFDVSILFSKFWSLITTLIFPILEILVQQISSIVLDILQRQKSKQLCIAK